VSRSRALLRQGLVLHSPVITRIDLRSLCCSSALLDDAPVDRLLLRAGRSDVIRAGAVRPHARSYVRAVRAFYSDSLCNAYRSLAGRACACALPPQKWIFFLCCWMEARAGI
jgi:hypothetical protein